MSDTPPSREEFDALTARVTAVEERIDAHAVVVASAIQRLDTKFSRRFDEVMAAVGQLDDRFDGLEVRFDGLDARVDGLDVKLDERFDAAMGGIGEVATLTRAIARHLGVDEA